MLQLGSFSVCCYLKKSFVTTTLTTTTTTAQKPWPFLFWYNKIRRYMYGFIIKKGASLKIKDGLSLFLKWDLPILVRTHIGFKNFS